MNSGVVLGGGLAGMLAATALARHVQDVTVIESDELPAEPVPRRGLPQARHLHVLMAGGARAMDELLPGTTGELRERGAHRLGIPEDVVTLSADGWQHRFPATQFMITCTRDLTDWVVRDRALRSPRITVRPGRATGLLGSQQRVTGVRVTGPSTPDGGEDLLADVVVDCTGRASRMRTWLAELGVTDVPEQVADAGMAYSTRVYAAPRGARTGFPVVNLFADYRSGRAGRSASLVPVEGGRWMISLTGTRGAHPPVDVEGFEDYAASLRDPLIARLMRAAEPLSEPRASRSATNRRLYPERAARWPDGVVVLGDALCAFNPVYGTGMSSAARSAVALATTLGERGVTTAGTAAAAQRAIAGVVEDAWTMAVSQDVRYPGTRVSDPALAVVPDDPGDRINRWVGTMVLRHPVVNAAMSEVTTLSGSLSVLQRPEVAAALSSPTGVRPDLSEAPLGPTELAVLAELAGERPPGPAATSSRS